MVWFGKNLKLPVTVLRARIEIMSKENSESSDLQALCVAILLVVSIVALAWVSIFQPLKENARIKAANEASAKVQQSASKQRELTDAEVGINPDDPLGLYSTNAGGALFQKGNWASSLTATERNFNGLKLYQDLATRKLYYLSGGAIYEYTESESLISYTPPVLTSYKRNLTTFHLPARNRFVDPLGLELQSSSINDQQHRDNQALLTELRRANDIAEQSAYEARIAAIWNRPLPTYSHYDYEIPSRQTPSAPINIYGNSSRIGNTVFHDYYSSDGQSIHGDSTRVGNSIYTTLYGY